MSIQFAAILRLGVVILTFLVSPMVSKCQVKYSVPPLVHYFIFYKNGKSLDVLNDSIRTSFFKFNDSLFSVKFFVNGKLKKECYCYYRGKQRKQIANILEIKNGKKELIKREFTVRELELKDDTCFSFLPSKLLKKD